MSSERIEKHQSELSSLESTDPEFFQFLKENDAGLLDFGKGEIDDIEEEEEDDSVQSSIDVTEEVLNGMLEKAAGGSLSALKSLLAVFRAACIPSGDVKEGKRVSRFTVNSPLVYELCMTRTLETAHGAFYKQLGLSSSSNISKDTIAGFAEHPKWKKIEVLVLSFFKSVLHTLASLVDHHSEQQEPVITYMITMLEHYIPLLAPMHRLMSTVLKVLVGVWCTHDQDAAMQAAEAKASGVVDRNKNRDAGAPNPARSHAFLRIRQMAMILPGSAAEDCFRTIYLAFTRHCKSYNEHTAPSVNFMMICVVELYRSDLVLAYQLAFLYVRQLGLFLRTAVSKKTSEAVKQLISWQYINCLRLWSRVISYYPTSNQHGLGELAFPLVQIILGVIQVAPSSYNIPCKLHLIGFMQQVAASCKLFIPTAPRLLEILETPELLNKPTPSTDIPAKLSGIVKLATDGINKAPVRDLIVAEVVKALRFEVEIYRFHPGFPEYIYLSVRKLRNFMKKCKIPKWKDLIRALVSHTESLATEAKIYRQKLGKSPMEISELQEFEPLLAVANARPTAKGPAILPVEQRVRTMMFGGGATLNVTANPDSGKTARVSFAGVSNRSEVAAMVRDGDSEDEEIEGEGETRKRKATNREDESVSNTKKKKKKPKKKKIYDVNAEGAHGEDEVAPMDDWSDDDN